MSSMTITTTPFHRVAIDLVCPFNPPLTRGNRYILTMVDYGTRWPEAVALKDISTITVAEALLDIFSRIGFPQEILRDQVLNLL